MKEEEAAMCGLEEEVQEVPALHRHSGRKYIQERGRPRLAFMGNHRKHDSPNHGRLFGRRPIQPTERESQKQQNQSGIRFRQRYSYNWEEHTLHIGLEELEANNLLHEMFHVFQTTQEPISSFKSSMMNREIEAHYAQYLFLQRSAEWTDKKQDKYAKSQRLRATTSLTKYVNQQGHDYNFILGYL